ncbi:tail fiber assembly protein [Enterobacter roggenkampii]|uniref:tail fiber assembly protein n=1 Tax=Enterobacter roggenkampii TaxID=1812935 RepID=UPI003BBC41C5
MSDITDLLPDNLESEPLYSIKFSISAQAFYDARYPTPPADAVEVSDEEHMRLITGMNDGERRVYVGFDGQFALSDRKPSQLHAWDEDNNEWRISDEDAARIHSDDSEREKSALRARAETEIGWRQDAVDADIATDEEKAALAAWKKYRVLLMRVDTSADEIAWPELPA